MPREVIYWNNIDIVGYLKRHLWIGQIDPWRRHDNGDPVLCLLTDVDPALKEVQQWIGEGIELTRTEFVKILQDNLIFVFRNIAEFEKYKDKKIDETKLVLKQKKNLSEERKEQLRNQVKKMNAKKQSLKEPSISQNPL